MSAAQVAPFDRLLTVGRGLWALAGLDPIDFEDPELQATLRRRTTRAERPKPLTFAGAIGTVHVIGHAIAFDRPDRSWSLAVGLRHKDGTLIAKLDLKTRYPQECRAFLMRLAPVLAYLPPDALHYLGGALLSQRGGWETELAVELNRLAAAREAVAV